MQGLTEDQIVELKLKDEWEEKCIPSGGPVLRKDEIGRRNGHGRTDFYLTSLYCKFAKNIHKLPILIFPSQPQMTK